MIGTEALQYVYLFDEVDTRRVARRGDWPGEFRGNLRHNIPPEGRSEPEGELLQPIRKILVAVDFSGLRRCAVVAP